MRRPERLLIFTGEGKGKTTAALGMVLRASGHGLRTLVVQFIKNDQTTGELAAVAHLPGVAVVQRGLGFLPREPGAQYEDHCAVARSAFELARAALASGDYGLLVLDEVCVALAAGLVAEDDLIDALGQTAPATRVVLTGRGATPRLIELADTVTEMRCVRHGYRQGIAAQAGVEF